MVGGLDAERRKHGLFLQFLRMSLKCAACYYSAITTLTSDLCIFIYKLKIHKICFHTMFNHKYTDVKICILVEIDYT